jgi:membrane associated rhomboid family serine protease
MAIQRYNPHAKPSVTIALIIANVAVGVGDIATGGLLERMFWARGIDIFNGEYWRLFTSAWVHADLMHLAFNCYGLWILGSILERMIGWQRMLWIYFVSLFGGAGLALVFYDSSTMMLGASGAVYGLFGGVLGVMYAMTGSLRGLLQIPFGRILLIWLGFGIYISIAVPGISLLGHVGGLIPGALLGIYFEHLWRKQVDIYHHLTAGLVGVAVVGLCVASVLAPTRATPQLVRALNAYDQGEFERGDRLVETATDKRLDEGATLLLNHLKLWREANASNPEEFDNAVLRWPLTHREPLGITRVRGTFGEREWPIPHQFLTDDMIVRRGTQPVETRDEVP